MAKVMIAYFSLTGNTENMAQYIGEGVRFSGNEAVVKKISDIKKADDLEGYDGYIFGSPTYHRDMEDPVKTFPLMERTQTSKGNLQALSVHILTVEMLQISSWKLWSMSIKWNRSTSSRLTSLKKMLVLRKV